VLVTLLFLEIRGCGGVANVFGDALQIHSVGLVDTLMGSLPRPGFRTRGICYMSLKTRGINSLNRLMRAKFW
jgi:hypothetical protein